MADYVIVHEPPNRPNIGGLIAANPASDNVYTETHDGIHIKAGRNLWSKQVSLGFSNTWSIAIGTSFNSVTQDYTLVDIGNTTDNINRITVSFQGTVANDPLQVLLYDSSGTLFKSYLYNSIGLSNHAVDIQHVYIITWDGTTLTVYLDGRVFASTSQTTDIAGTQTDTDRRVSFGSTTAGATFLSGYTHHLAIWGTCLAASAIASMHQAGMYNYVDYRNDINEYVSKNSLIHYWFTGENTKIDSDSFTFICDNDGLRKNPRLGGNDSGSNTGGSNHSWTPSSSLGLGAGRNSFTADAGKAWASSTNQNVGIDNTWTISGLQRRVSTTTAVWTVVDIGNTGSTVNEILIQVIGATINEPIRVTLYNSSGSIFKLYEWDLFDTDEDGAIALWFYQYHLTWDGTNLLMYRNGSLIEPSRKTTDNTGTMTNTDRVVSLLVDKDGAGVTYRSHHVETVIWNRALSPQEIEACWNGGQVALDYNRNSIGYMGASNMKHWWRLTPNKFGAPNNLIITDEVSNNAIDITTNALGAPVAADIKGPNTLGAGPALWLNGGKALYSPAALLGLANNWVIDIWQHTLAEGVALGDQCLLDIGAGGPNGIEITYLDSVTDTLEIKLWDRNGVLFKHYEYNNALSATSVWRYFLISWNGSSLNIYLNMGLSAQSVSTTNVNLAGVMADTSRAVYFGCDQNLARFVYGMYVSTLRMWEGTGVPTGSGVQKYVIMMSKSGKDFKKSFGSYSSSSLRHWYNFGRKPSSVGFDFATPSTGKRNLESIGNVSQRNVICWGPA